MPAYIVDPAAASMNAIPLLDASFLPSAEDWALVEAIQADTATSGDVDSEFDRPGRFRVAAAYDE
jgi:hypothetical protein